MNTYNVIVRSEARTIGIGAIFLIGFLFIAGFIFPMANSFMGYSLIILFFIAAHFSFKKFSMARTEWVLNDTGINIKWITQFYGNASETINIKWTDIEKYREINGKGYNVFKIYLVDGSIVEFGHAGLFVVDDFDKFYEQFQEMFIKNKHPE